MSKAHKRVWPQELHALRRAMKAWLRLKGIVFRPEPKTDKLIAAIMDHPDRPFGFLLGKKRELTSESVREARQSLGMAVGLPGHSDAARRLRQAFYNSKEWRRLRYMALQKYGGRCQCCGARGSSGTKLHVDHIKPRSRFPELALSLSNLQVLCEDCNLGKSNLDATDWRPSERAAE